MATIMLLAGFMFVFPVFFGKLISALMANYFTRDNSID